MKRDSMGDAGGFAKTKSCTEPFPCKQRTSFGELANHIFNKLKRMVALTPSTDHKKAHPKSLNLSNEIGKAGFSPMARLFRKAYACKQTSP